MAQGQGSMAGTGMAAGIGSGIGYGFTYTGSGSGSNSGSGEAILADGTYLAGLAMGDSYRTLPFFAFLYSSTLTLVLFFL